MLWNYHTVSNCSNPKYSGLKPTVGIVIPKTKLMIMPLDQQAFLKVTLQYLYL